MFNQIAFQKVVFFCFYLRYNTSILKIDYKKLFIPNSGYLYFQFILPLKIAIKTDTVIIKPM